MKAVRWLLLGWIFSAVCASGHVVSQIYGEWKSAEPWEIEILFDAGYAVPEWRGDPDSPAPSRDWLAGLGEAGWQPLRTEAERYLRESLSVGSSGWTTEFIDFKSDPPDFPVLLNDGAYFRILIRGKEPQDGPAEISWSDGERPDFVMKLPDDDAGYLTISPGETRRVPTVAGSASWLVALKQGFLHVLPLGLDHVLFVLGLFFYRREWRPLIAQSLAFTAAHTLTLGLAAAGWVRVPGAWVEPAIALSLAVVALENLRAAKPRPIARLAVVFGLGLVHGLGFAGALSVWIRPGEGFLTALLSANLGVELAQAALLAAAWCVTIGWHETSTYQKFRLAGCLAIAATGLIWFVQRAF